MHARARLRPTKVLVVLAFVLAALALGGGKAMADSSTNSVGAVYTQTNTPGNAVQVFYRSADGHLTAGPAVPTGGDGSLVNPPFGLAVTDSNYSVVLTQDNRVLLVTNNASGDISSFRVLPDGNIVPADLESSHGLFPNSIATTNTGNGRTLVYVLNEDSESVVGFTLSRDGQLTYIPGSDRQVSGANSASVEFDPSGHVLTVTNRNDVFVTPSGTISTFTVDPATGLLGSETVTAATGTGAPFGLDYTNRDQLLVANAGEFDTGLTGSASSYDVSKQTGAVSPVDLEPTGGFFSITCWVRVTPNNQYAYYTNPGDAVISGFAISSSGALAPIGQTPNGRSPLDLDTSVDGRYLYVVSTTITQAFAFLDSAVNEYRINSDGSLTLIGTVPNGSGGNSGLASY